MLTENMERNTNLSIQDVLQPEVYVYPTAPIEEQNTTASDNTIINNITINGNNCNNSPNRWDVVWAEATLIPPAAVTTVENVEQSESQPPAPSNSQQSADVSTVVSKKHNSSVTNSTTITPSNNNKNESSNPNDILLLPISNCFDLLFGIPFAFAGIVVTFGLELASTIIYFGAWVCYYYSGIWILYVVLRPVVGVCLLADVLILLISILITEILGLSSRSLTSLSGGCSSGQRWHQYIRRICHLFRWAWRETHSNLEPKRLIPSCHRKNEQAPIETSSASKTRSASKTSSASKRSSASSRKALNEQNVGMFRIQEIDVQEVASSNIPTNPPMNPDFQGSSNV